MKLKLLILLFLGTFLTGCASNQVDVNPRVNDPHILVENNALYDWLELQHVNYFKRKDGLLIVEAQFKNNSYLNQEVAYKLDWMDQHGFIEKSIMSRWIKTEVEAERSFIIRGIAPSVKIDDFKISLQKPTSDDRRRENSYNSQYQN